MVFQLGSALLDACVLSVLNRGDAYGYALTQDIKDIVEVSESTLYPVLRRLQKDECLSTYDEPFAGRNRRYYKITARGADTLNGYISEWHKFKSSLDKILLGGMGNE